MKPEEIKQLIEDNFDLEQHILRCWNITTDLREILDDWQTGRMSEENTMQALDAYIKVYENRFDRTFRNYETVCQGLHGLRAIVEGLNAPESVVFSQQNSGEKKPKKGSKKVDQ